MKTKNKIQSKKQNIDNQYANFSEITENQLHFIFFYVWAYIKHAPEISNLVLKLYFMNVYLYNISQY